MKRIIASAGALVLATAMLASCSAYNNPEKYITVPELSSITISQAELDESLQEQIDSILEQNRKEEFKEIDEAAQNGDQVNIHYVGKAADESVTLSEQTLAGMNNKTYDDEGNLKEGSDLILGSGSFIGEYTDKDGNKTPGFEKQIEGMKKGETKDITVIFPDSYSNDATLQGVKVIFTVTVNSVSRVEVDKNTLASIGYSFIDPDAKTDGEASADSESDTAAPETTEAPETEEAPKTEEKSDFSTLFKDGKFDINYSEEEDKDDVFNDIFKISEVREKFIGLNKYEEYEHKFTVPTDVKDTYKDYAGREITVVFTVNSATTLPEWNDEFVTELTKDSGNAYTSADEYGDLLMETIISNAAYEAVMNAVTVNEYPKSEVEKLYNKYVDQMVENQIGQPIDNLTADQLRELIDDATYEGIYDSATSQAMASVKERLIFEYLFKELDITLSSKEYDEELESYYKDYVVPNQTYFYYYYGVVFTSKEDVEDYYGKEELEVQFKASKMMEELPKYIKIVE